MSDEVVETQMMKVQRMLLNGPVCATTFLANYMSAARSRVSELRAAGWSIDAATCDLGHNHRTRQIVYRLTHEGNCRCPRCVNRWRESFFGSGSSTPMQLDLTAVLSRASS